VQCYQEYCSECVRINGRCDTCATLTKEGTPAHFGAAAWLDNPDLRKLIAHYEWRTLNNERFTIYLGEGPMFHAAVIVVEHTPGPEKVVHYRRISVADRMRGLIG
jgi:hypothetical protein